MRPVTGSRCPNCGGDVSWTGQEGIDLPVGTVLNGGNGLRTYQIGAARGKGGFGITYIALEINSGRRMAIKEYFPTRWAFRGGSGVDVQAMTGQEEPFRSGMNSFLDEGKMLLSQDDLPCVVHVIDYFQANGTAYLVMEYLDGVALHTQMTRMGGRIPVNELMPRLAPLLRDIGQLHRRGVIHRDISPDNIMWMPDGGLKLLDFGSARSMVSGKSMTVLMKQGFSPVEQYSSKGQGPYTDIYALAATIYYCITGVIPPDSMERMTDDTLKSPIALGAALTVQQETALLWALSIQPNARPQSMEEFAAMLYKEGPAPGPAPAGGAYTGSTAFMPRSEYTPQVPPRPVTEQNTVYQYGQGYAGQPAGPVQYPGPPVGPGQNGTGGGGKKLPVIIGASAAVIVALLIGVIVWMNGNKEETADNTRSPGQSLAPTYSFAPVVTAAPTPGFEPTPTAAPTQNISTGVTDDGFYYEIIGQDHVVLTGCNAGANFSYMPDDVDGIPITAIADGAFAGASTGGFVKLPLRLETIGGNAFRGCTDLSYVYAYDDVDIQSSSFSGCDNLWFVAVHRNTALSGWRRLSGVSLYYYGMETEVGVLDDINRSGSLLTGETESGNTVLLDVRPGTDTVTGLDGVDWICSGALDHLSYGATVELGENTMYSYETFNLPFSWHAPDGALSDMWLLSCATAYYINADRPSGATQIVPDVDLMYAAITRAEEYGELHDINTRPDGSSWSTALDEYVSYNWATGSAGYGFDDYVEMWNYAEDYMTETYTPALSGSNYAGQYYSRIGVAAVQQSDGQYAWWGFVMIP